MLDPALRFDGFDTRDWSRLLSLWPSSAAAASQAPMGVLLVHDGRRVRKAIRADLVGVPELEDRWPLALGEVAAMHRAPWVVALRVGALEELAEEIAVRTKRSDDMLDQVLTAWRVARELAASKRLETWPSSWEAVPAPTRAMVVGAMGLLCPPKHVVVLAVWRDHALWTSVALRRGIDTVDWIAGPEELRSQLAGSGGEMTRAHERLVRRVRDWMGPVALAMSAQARDWQALGASVGSVGAWVRATGRGRLVVDPLPVGMAIPIAVDAARVALVLARGLVQRAVPGAAGLAQPGDAAASWMGQVADLWEATRMLFGMRTTPGQDGR
ncbi:MAG: hypothetical protein MUF54_02330 [Polyangiaceae bacterium]|jgi:hypothetical protein|nr:hypothetical protein [Polyangiaceae bacterium]